MSNQGWNIGWTLGVSMSELRPRLRARGPRDKVKVVTVAQVSRPDIISVAEGVGFEPTRECNPLPVFKTGALNHSATLP